MDTISLSQCISDLDASDLEKIRVEELTPGCVIASPTFKNHVVVELPERLNDVTTTHALTLRHVHGGHTVRPYFPGGDTTVRVFRTRLPQLMIDEVPDVPPCVIPDEPAVGDRVVMHWRNGSAPEVYEWDAEHWCSVAADEDGYPRVGRYSSPAMRDFVRLTDRPIEYGWYVYEPAKAV
jgi:hypothetical protein